LRREWGIICHDQIVFALYAALISLPDSPINPLLNLNAYCIREVGGVIVEVVEHAVYKWEKGSFSRRIMKQCLSK
jgi:hypothetical protein